MKPTIEILAADVESTKLTKKDTSYLMNTRPDENNRVTLPSGKVVVFAAFLDWYPLRDRLRKANPPKARKPRTAGQRRYVANMVKMGWL